MTITDLQRFHVARATVRNMNPSEVAAVRDYDRLKKELDDRVSTLLLKRHELSFINSITAIHYNKRIEVVYKPFRPLELIAPEKVDFYDYSEIF